MKETVRTEKNLRRVHIERNPEENLLVDVDMLDKKMTAEDDQSTKAPNRNLVEFKFNSSLTKPRSPSLKIAKTEDNILKTAKTLVRMTTRKMTPAKKKMSSQTRNSPMARSVAKKLGLMNLPCVQLMGSWLDQQQHLRPHAARDCGQVQNYFIITKPIFHSTESRFMSVQRQTGPIQARI